jgi:hypothetical protein
MSYSNEQPDIKKMINDIARKNLSLREKVDYVKQTSRNDMIEVIRSLMRKDKK